MRYPMNNRDLIVSYPGFFVTSVISNVMEIIDHNATSEEILSKIYDDFYDRFNLIRGKNRK